MTKEQQNKEKLIKAYITYVLFSIILISGIVFMIFDKNSINVAKEDNHISHKVMLTNKYYLNIPPKPKNISDSSNIWLELEYFSNDTCYLNWYSNDLMRDYQIEVDNSKIYLYDKLRLVDSTAYGLTKSNWLINTILDDNQ